MKFASFMAGEFKWLFIMSLCFDMNFKMLRKLPGLVQVLVVSMSPHNAMHCFAQNRIASTMHFKISLFLPIFYMQKID